VHSGYSLQHLPIRSDDKGDAEMRELKWRDWEMWDGTRKGKGEVKRYATFHKYETELTTECVSFYAT